MEENNEQSFLIGEQSEIFCFCSDLKPFQSQQKSYTTILTKPQKKSFKKMTSEDNAQIKQGKSVELTNYHSSIKTIEEQDSEKKINRQDSADDFLKISKSQKLLLTIKYKMEAFKNYDAKLNKIEWTLNREIININVIKNNNEKLIKRLTNQTISLQ